MALTQHFRKFAALEDRFPRAPMSGLAAALLVALSLVATPAQAAISDEAFAACLADLQDQARDRGFSPAITDTLIPGLEVQNRVVELDRSQPEFVQTFGEYLSIRLSESRITRGREQLGKQAELLAELTRQYGVPGQYLMAFWGLETNFGGYMGDLPTLDSLATLACDQRRSAFFTGEFMTALQLMEREELQPEQMRGSWAGAVGHTQFMPSSYLRYAVDGDGDGSIDLWRSEADALASGAHFLQQLGWVPRLKWGREVRLPEGFDYSLAGRDNWTPLSRWAAAGVRKASGEALPGEDIEAALLVPAGAEGPAFLVYRNFEVIMRWNRSESYALSVGLLANAIAGSPGLVVDPPDGGGMRSEALAQLQRALAAAGFDPGPADGIWGPGSRGALTDWQRSEGMVADGFPDEEVLERLLPGLETAQ